MTLRFVPTHTESALDVVATERERTTAERDAFTRFATRIAALDESSTRVPPRNEPAAVHTVLQSNPAADTTLARVRDAYRETVMSVPHYDQEYDESLRESLTEEFTPEIAVALTSGDQFTPQLQNHLVTQSRTAATNRDTFLTAIEDEASALEAADERLTDRGNELSDLLDTRSLESWSNEELSTAREKLRVYERECEELSTNRQATLHKQRLPSLRRIDLAFAEYLYQPLPVTYPMLADITSLTETLRTIESDVGQVLGPL